MFCNKQIYDIASVLTLLTINSVTPLPLRTFHILYVKALQKCGASFQIRFSELFKSNFGRQIETDWNRA